MKNYIFLLLISTFLACGATKKIDLEPINEIIVQQPKMISSGKGLADSPFITIDQNKNIVLSWVEGKAENTMFYFSVSKDNGKTFSKPKEISPAKGLSPHHESMPKIAFKKDGTIIAVYQRRTPTPKNRFAGAIYYTQSFNEGQTWTNPNYLHTDTTKGIGRSFFDISVLPDGEIGAIWLDGRKRQPDGSTLCFSKTSKNSGFGKDIEIGQKTCQCCRTDIFVDNKNIIHVAYRDIINDSIRDIVHLSSNDNGATFTTPKRISEDNWVIYGCPHTGPTITNSKNGVSFFWFTSGGLPGVYTTELNEKSNTFTKRKLVNPHARHPQSITLKNGTIVLTWDETFKTKMGYINKIGVLFKTTDGKVTTKYITTENEDCNYPVLTKTKDENILLSWIQKPIKGGISQVYQTLIINFRQ